MPRRKHSRVITAPEKFSTARTSVKSVQGGGLVTLSYPRPRTFQPAQWPVFAQLAAAVRLVNAGCCHLEAALARWSLTRQAKKQRAWLRSLTPVSKDWLSDREYREAANSSGHYYIDWSKGFGGQ